MEHSQHSSPGSSSKKEQQKYMKKSQKISGFLTRYILNTWTLLNGERLKRVAFGEKDESKPHKTIILVGETGVGKSTLINAMVNYMLGVDSTDQIWFEIIETKENQSDSQTEVVTVYDVFTEHSPFSLTVIDTPGFGNKESTEEDVKVAEGLLELFTFHKKLSRKSSSNVSEKSSEKISGKSSEYVYEIDAVCLVVLSSTVRLTEKQHSVFKAVQSLFGNDVMKNFVLLITRAPTKPKNSIKAIKNAKIPCAQTDDGEPVHFWFDNCHCENFYANPNMENEKEELLQGFQAAWDLFSTSMENFLSFLNGRKTVSLKNTESVLKCGKELLEHINNLREDIKALRSKKKDLEQAKEAHRQHEKENEREKMINFQYEVEESYKEKVPIDPLSGSSKEATCCNKCEENCHYPGCWWVRDLSWCSVMSKGKCTKCTGRCDFTDHVKEGKIYVRKTRKVKKIKENEKKKYETESEQNKRRISLLEEELTKQEKDITGLVDKCINCTYVLQGISLKSDSLSKIQDLDLLIKEAKETQCIEIVQKFEELKKRTDEMSKGAEE